MGSYAILLKPDDDLSEKILSIKEECESIVGDQLYLSDPPHITLIVTNVNDFSVWEKRFTLFLDAITPKLKDIPLEVTGWNVFGSDPVTGRKTLVCDVSSRTANELKDLQKSLASLIKPFRAGRVLKRYADAKDKLNDAERSNLSQFGYPFIGDNWHPHLSIASFVPESFDLIWDKFEELCPKGRFSIKGVLVYYVNDDNSLELVKEFSLT